MGCDYYLTKTLFITYQNSDGKEETYELIVKRYPHYMGHFDDSDDEEKRFEYMEQEIAKYSDKNSILIYDDEKWSSDYYEKKYEKNMKEFCEKYACIKVIEIYLVYGGYQRF